MQFPNAIFSKRFTTILFRLYLSDTTSLYFSLSHVCSYLFLMEILTDIAIYLMTNFHYRALVLKELVSD